MAESVLFVAGPTGGHLYPAIAVAEKLGEIGILCDFLCGDREIESRILDETSFPWHRVPRLGALTPAAVLVGGWRLRRLIDEIKPGAIAACGGAATILPAILCRWRSLPLFLLEQNRVMGRANRILSPLARRIFLSFADTRHAPRRNIMRVGCPVRASFHRQSPPLMTRLRILVLGGSQGARAIDRWVCDSLPHLKSMARDLEFTHLTVNGDCAAVQRCYDDAGIDAHCVDYLADPGATMRSIALVIARSGGSTCAELIATGRASLLLPYPHHRDRQQFLNADALVEAGAALRIDGADPRILAEFLSECSRDDQRLTAMGQAAASLNVSSSAQAIAVAIATHIEAAPSGARGSGGEWVMGREGAL